MEIKKWFAHSPYKYLSGIVVVIGITLIYLFSREFNLYNFINGVQAGGLVVLFCGLLSMVNYFGAFDLFGYGFARMFGNKGQFKDLVDYTERVTINRKKRNYPFIPFICVGILVILLSLLLKITL